MIPEQLRQLESKLWESADQLRANSRLTATEYSFPVLGLIFLRHAYNRFESARWEIERHLPVHPQRGRRPVTKDDFLEAKAIFLPEKAQWPYLASLPEGVDTGQAVDDAMRLIESEYEVLSGVLPKDYSLFEKDLLQQLIRIFNTELLDDVSGDVFGRIYEYFLNKFAQKGAQEGGEFFTPPSLVNTIVNIIEPNHGTVFDPACGSAGMFVQTAHFLEYAGQDAAGRVTFFGQEKADTNTRLAKMNMAVHGLDANIIQGNTFYEDKHELVGRCDFVMANPPFNVDGVDKSKDGVKNDARLPFGLPKNDNANYLWIQYFYSYLNPTGRAGFVMASSASDAGHSERLIREKLVNTGAVDVMVSIGNKFFYTRSLPCTLWFFDRAKENDPLRAYRTLMLDLREVYRKVSSNLHDFTEEHLMNIHAIVALYRGNKKPFEEATAYYQEFAFACKAEAIGALHDLEELGLEIDQVHPFVGDLKAAKRTVHQAARQWAEAARETLRSDAVRKDREKREALQARLAAVEDAAHRFDEAATKGLYFFHELDWLSDHFPDGMYCDRPGLCRVVDRDEIAASDYSLTPGRYVGVAATDYSGFDFEERLGEIKIELKSLNEEATELAARIMDDLEELGI